MIGLPLRLLAREVYDRVRARVGDAEVALITGEEKRVPARARYFVCTVESMPVTRRVDFLAVDEIQLVAHRQRGHVFTDRLLHARGEQETWFMGSPTVADLLLELVPTARIERHPRLSELRATPTVDLGALPPRSAVVAFTVPQVYALAEQLRRRRGGAAVVLGALSPRTRNAQVAMYQAGEVQHLVATDAIGMGLNMDLDHVAFAALRKHDGRELRALDAEEVGQIAGRAGRYVRDGTFGTVAPVPELSDALAHAVETHTFTPHRRAVWRNAELDLRSIEALLDSLKRRPPHPALRIVERAEDFDALLGLAKLPDVRRVAVGQAAVELLWAVCQIPDFRQLHFDRHVPLLAEIYAQLCRAPGTIDPEWLDDRLRRLDAIDGDIDALTMRIAFVRTWTYVVHRGDWVRDAELWQARARAIEDRLSDALHERLVQRFVEHDGPRGQNQGRSRPRGSRARASLEPPEPPAAVPTALLPLWHLRQTLAPEPRDAPPELDPLTELLHALAAVAGTTARAPLRWRDHQIVIDARGPRARSRRRDRPHHAARSAEALHFAGSDADADAAPPAAASAPARGPALRWEGTIATLARGRDLLHPSLTLDPRVPPERRSEVLAQLEPWVRAQVDALLATLRRTDERALQGPGRGVRYQLEQGLGLVRAVWAAEQLERLGDGDRRVLAAGGVRFGAWTVAVPAASAEPHRSTRWALARAWHGERLPPRPAGDPAVLPLHDAAARDAHLLVGYVALEQVTVRADVLERVLIQATRHAARGPFTAAQAWTGIDERAAGATGREQVLRELGYLARADGRWSDPQHARPRPPRPRPRSGERAPGTDPR